MMALGGVLVLFGLLVLLAVPAARQMDEEEAERVGEPGMEREEGVKNGGIIALGSGLVMVAAGYGVGRWKARSSRPR